MTDDHKTTIAKEAATMVGGVAADLQAAASRTYDSTVAEVKS